MCLLLFAVQPIEHCGTVSIMFIDLALAARGESHLYLETFSSSADIPVKHQACHIYNPLHLIYMCDEPLLEYIREEGEGERSREGEDQEREV